MADTRSKWHDEAIRMKRDGMAIKDIAEVLGRKINTVRSATRGVPAKFGSRRNRGDAGGFRMGSKLRVAVSFSDIQVAHINKLAERDGISFSLAVSNLIDASAASLREE